MKKIAFTFILFFIIFNFAKASSPGGWGSGQLQLSERAVEEFIIYLRADTSKFKKNKGQRVHPIDFYISTDGGSTSFWYCPYSRCTPMDPAQGITNCERKTGKVCKRFALRRTVKWKNGINPAKGKASRFSSKWSDSEIRAKLKELGFYDNDFSEVKKKTEPNKKIKKPKITKKKDKDKTNVVSQLESLIELHKSGVLTKEEFESAKKKLLDG
tara:strand:- start:88 stop:726 length:639 start_codon:yes stop_codon:yes gene_type:complete